MEKSRADERPWLKNKKRIKNFCQEKKQIPLWKRLVLAELHAGVQISNKEVAVKPKFAVHNVKSEVSFSLYKPLYKNIDKLRVHQSPRIGKLSVDSLSCSLAQFPIFQLRCEIFLCLWQLCALLWCPPHRSTDHVCNGLLFPGDLWFMVIDARRFRCPIGWQFQEAR